MKNLTKNSWLVLLAFSISIVSCDLIPGTGDDDDDNKTENDYVAPSISKKDTLIVLPKNMKANVEAKANNLENPDFHPQSGLAMVETMNSMTQFVGSFEKPEDPTSVVTNLDGSKTYIYTIYSQSVFITYHATATKKTWKYETQETGKEKIIFLTAEESNDGKSGGFAVYNMTTAINKMEWNYEYSIDASNTITATLNEYDVNDNSVKSKWEVHSKSDKSGDAKIFNDTKLIWNIVWDKEGHGTYNYSPVDEDAVNGTF